MREADRRNERPRIIHHDGLQSYNDGINGVFYSNRSDRRVTQVRSLGLGAGDKNKIERFHSTLKGRYHSMRGLKNPATGYAILNGYIINYNFRTPHHGLRGLTPAEASGIKLPYEDGWANSSTGQRSTRPDGSALL